MRAPWVSLLLVAACGGSESTKRQPEAEPSFGAMSDGRHSHAPELDDEGGDDVEVEGLKGHLEGYDIQAGIKPQAAALSACFERKARGARFLGGKLELAFTVATDGTVKSVLVRQSDLGAWEVEKCLLGIARGLEFARPKGGEADFTVPLDFSGGKSVVWWTEDQSDPEIAAHVAELDACSAAEADGGPHDLALTLYVGNRGAVKSIGFASASGAVAETWADCARMAAAAWQLTDPRGHIAKAGYRYRPE